MEQRVGGCQYGQVDAQLSTCRAQAQHNRRSSRASPTLLALEQSISQKCHQTSRVELNALSPPPPHTFAHVYQSHKNNY